MLDASNFDQANEVLASMTGSWTKRIALAHLKDVCRLGPIPRERHHHVADAALYGNMEYPAPGRGDLKLSLYLRHLKVLGYRGPMIIEHVADVQGSCNIRRRDGYRKRFARLGRVSL